MDCENIESRKNAYVNERTLCLIKILWPTKLQLYLAVHILITTEAVGKHSKTHAHTYTYTLNLTVSVR